MSRDPSAVVPKEPNIVGPSRVYVHQECGGATSVNGHEFVVLADPFSFVSKTLCSQCLEFASLDRFAWADSKENIADYRHRIRSQMSPLMIALAYAVGPIFGALIGGVIGVFWPPGKIPETVTGVIGGGIVGWLVLQIPCRKYFGFDYRHIK